MLLRNTSPSPRARLQDLKKCSHWLAKKHKARNAKPWLVSLRKGKALSKTRKKEHLPGMLDSSFLRRKQSTTKSLPMVGLRILPTTLGLKKLRHYYTRHSKKKNTRIQR